MSDSEKSESATHTQVQAPSPVIDASAAEAAAPVRPPPRRLTIFERPDVILSLSPAAIVAIQQELVESRLEFEEKCQRLIADAQRNLVEIMRMNAQERLTSEAQRLKANERWEERSEEQSNREGSSEEEEK